MTDALDGRPSDAVDARGAARVLVPTGLRLVLVGLLAAPTASKFLTYGSSVAFFGNIGVPHPALAVLVVGGIELAALVSLALGVGGRLAALALLPVMLVAVFASGLDWKNATVLVAAVGVVVLGTGPYSLWRPFAASRR